MKPRQVVETAFAQLVMQPSKGKILVVDDDYLNRVKLSTNLEEAGYAVMLAKEGQEALQLMRAQPFDTVLLDLMIPVMDGFQALQLMKSDESLQHLPVIVISGEDDLDSVVRCIEMGAADHLPKPFNPIVLRARVGACVNQKRSHDRETQLFSELQQRYQQLQELEKQRDDLTHMIVHDLRTPLTSFLSGVQAVPMMGELNDGQSECLDIATQGGEKLLGMINELLDIGKMEDGTLQLILKQADLIFLAEAAINQVNHLLREKNLTLQREFQDGLPLLLVDEEKLLRVLVNLLGNAIKFTPPEGTITVSIKADKAGITCLVRDTGEGIPPEYFERIFEKFGQVETRKSGRKMSTGLGLTFCKMVIEKHGGHIWVESEPGKGSTFSFYLPTGR